MRTILIVTAAWVGFDVLFVLLMIHFANKRHGICAKCRYSAINSAWGSCSILGCPTGLKQCKYYESWRAEA